MKKITKEITFTETAKQQDGETATVHSDGDSSTYYVSDAYDAFNWCVARVWGTEQSEDPNSACINYTQTLLDLQQKLDDLYGELDEAFGELEKHANIVAADTTLAESDRKNVSDALNEASSALYALWEETGNANSVVYAALDAFERLPL